MAWRVAASLLKLRDQVNAIAPSRSKTDDGTIGDERHQASQSDHNPDGAGVVRAMDLTHDPKHGFDSYKFAEMLRQNRDPRLKYVISNGRIWSASVAAYQWRKYTGSNKHDRHVHISVVPDKRADSTADWKLDIAPTPAKPEMVAKIGFEQALKRLLVSEGGNDDDPRDSGGRTSRGITQSEYNEWRKTHPGLPQDVWTAPNSAVHDIYRRNYWEPLRCDELPPGVDYAVFDYGVNSGIRQAAKALQEVVAVNPDGILGPITMKAVKDHSASDIVNGLKSERMNYLHHRPNWSVYGGGWTNRVNRVTADALSDTGAVA